MQREPVDAVDEVARLERAVRAAPADLRIHAQLAQAHSRLLEERHGEAEAALARICDEEPRAFTSLLLASRLAELRGDRRAAQRGYLRAIKTAQLLGFWQDDASTPQWLRALVVGGMEVAQRGRLEILEEWFTPLIARYGRDELTRVGRAAGMYVGLEPLVLADPRQRPSVFYVPDLPVAPVFPRDALPFAESYEAQTDAIAAEVAAALGGDGIQPFHYDVPEAQRGALTRGEWDAYFFFDEGERIDAHHAACPKTSAALAELPLDFVRQRGPEVCFSIMRPGAHILPHRGVTNARAVLHLGLDIPEDCALNLVGVQEVLWQRGACWAFDDTFEHEAWNRSTRTRAILLGDIWNPFLRPAERLALAELIPQIGDWNRATAPRLAGPSA